MHDDVLVCYVCGSDDVTVSAYVNVNTGRLVEILYDRGDYFCNECNSDTSVIDKDEYEIRKNEEDEDCEDSNESRIL